MNKKKIKIIACEVMKEELNAVLPSEIETEYIEMGFHLYPQKLRAELQRLIDECHGYERIVLAFGLCGGAAHGLKSADSILTIPRVHDCIPIFLHQKGRAVGAFEKECGVFYLTTGWLIAERTIIFDYQRLKDRYGEKKAENLFSRMYDSYHKVLFVRTGCPGETKAIAESRKIAALLHSRHEIAENRSAFFAKIAAGPWDNGDFVNVAPGESISEEAFLTEWPASTASGGS